MPERPAAEARQDPVAVSHHGLRQLATAMAMLLLAGANAAQPQLEDCHLKGLDRPALCGRLARAEDPDAPAGRSIEIRYAVVPALAQRKREDAVFVFAGGPGQSAARSAALLWPALARINMLRDIVFVDLRGTGGSNRLSCADGADAALPDAASLRRQLDALPDCIAHHDADPRQYATWIAVQDVDAVRDALGIARINAWGGSYGTRAALEYLRQFPQRVRSMVLDGVAPADMHLPAAAAADTSAALARIAARCTADASCARADGPLDANIDALFAQVGRGYAPVVADPLTGQSTAWPLDRLSLAGTLRAPLYAPALASLLPYAVSQARSGNFAPLAALGRTLTAAGDDFADLLHYAVVCAEDEPRITSSERESARGSAFGQAFLALYDDACSRIPVRPVPAAFYAIPRSQVPVLVLSGGLDPVTPPRYGDAVVRALPQARHLIAPHLGHGVSLHGCAPDLVARFVRQAGFEGIDGACLAAIPAPPLFAAPRPAAR